MLLPITGLTPHPDNPNEHPEEQIQALMEIIQYQGLRKAIVVSTLSKYMVTGHGTLEALRRLGWKEVPVSSFRAQFKGPVIAAGGYTLATAQPALASGEADAVAFAKAFIANPDLVERFRREAPLAAPDVSTFYGGGEKGYADYPALVG